MMKLLRFEMSKLWLQKKFLLLFFIVLLSVGGIFLHNFSQQSLKGERALEKFGIAVNQTDQLYAKLNALNRENALDELQEKQYVYTNEMANAFFHWKSAIYNKNWDAIPKHEGDFLTNLQEFEKVGGEFTTLQGLERKLAIAKNDWLLLHKLSYEDDKYPTSPALILVESTSFLFGVLGILILLLFFGNTITMEKEQKTWLTLKTQPISKWKLIAAKYSSLLIVILVFVAMVVGVGLAIPLLFSEYAMNLHYPQILIDGEAFAIFSTFEYLTRGIILFVCASTFAFSLHFLISIWVKNSFGALVVTGLILLLGFIATDLFTLFQSAWNPFQYFRFSEILAKIPQSTDWFYPFAALLWSILLVTFSIFLPEKELSFFGSSENKKPFRRGGTMKPIDAIGHINVLEWRKMRRNGLMKQLYFILSILIVFGYFAIADQAREREEVYFNELITNAERHIDEGIPFYEETIGLFEEAKKEAEEAGDEAIIAMYNQQIKEHEDTIASVWKELDEKKAVISLYKNNDWVSFYSYQLEQNESYKEFSRNADGPKSISKFTIEASIAEKKWLIKYNIQPIFKGDMIPTIHDVYGDDPTYKKEFEEGNSKVDHSGLFSLYLYFDKYFYFIPLLLFLFLLGAGFSNERGKKATLQFLRTQPVAEKKIYLGKGISSTTIALISSLSLIAFVPLVGTIFNRFGDWHYPILRYDSKRFVESVEYTGIRTTDGRGHFISIGDYLLESSLLFICILLFSIGLSMFLSLFLKGQFVVFASAILVGVGGYIGSTQFLSEKLHLSPFTYLNIAKVTNGELSELFNNPSINVQTGSLMLLVLTVLLFVVGYFGLSMKNLVRN